MKDKQPLPLPPYRQKKPTTFFAPFIVIANARSRRAPRATRI